MMDAGPTRSSITYDKNGNCTGFAATAANYSSFIGPSGTFVYDWDSADRLVAVHNGTLHSEFGYDGYGRCVRIVKKGSVLGIGISEEAVTEFGVTNFFDIVLLALNWRRNGLERLAGLPSCFAAKAWAGGVTSFHSRF